MKNKYFLRDLQELDESLIYVKIKALPTSPAALFFRLRLPFTLIRHEDAAFRKRSSNRCNLTTSALHLSVDGKHFENGALRKR